MSTIKSPADVARDLYGESEAFSVSCLIDGARAGIREDRKQIVAALIAEAEVLDAQRDVDDIARGQCCAARDALRAFATRLGASR